MSVLPKNRPAETQSFQKIFKLAEINALNKDV